MQHKRISGISPYNRNIFPDIKFAPGYTTDCPMPNDTRGPQNIGLVPVQPIDLTNNKPLRDEPQATTDDVGRYTASGDKELQPSRTTISQNVEVTSCTGSANKEAQAVTHENIRRSQNAGQRKTSQNNRKRSNAILTHTPIKEALVCHVNSMGRALAFRADGPGSIPGPA